MVNMDIPCTIIRCNLGKMKVKYCVAEWYYDVRMK